MIPDLSVDERSLLSKLRKDNERLRKELADSEADKQLLFEFQIAVGRWNAEHRGEPGACWQELPGVNPPCGLCRAWREFKRKSLARKAVAGA